MIEKKAGYRGSTAPKLEDMKVSHRYAITICPQDQPKSYSLKHLAPWLREWHDWLINVCEDNELILYFESSPTGRAHFHGYLTVYSYIGYLKFLTYICQHAHVEVDTIADDKVWNKYVTKQYFIWKEILKDFPWYEPMTISRYTAMIGKPVEKVPHNNLLNYGYDESL